MENKNAMSLDGFLKNIITKARVGRIEGFF